MTNPEPTDVGPVVGGDKLVADSDRQHVITLLTAAHAEGQLSAEERNHRIAAATTAEVFDDLVPLTRDLVESSHASTVNYDETSATDAADPIGAIFAGATRNGHWRVRKNTSLLVVFGGIDLDLTEAVFESHELTMNIFCLFGGIELKVPEGTEIHNQVIAMFGGSDTHKLVPPHPSAPKLILKGFVGFGGVNVRHPKRRKRRH